ncbi:MAG: GTP-binding protein [Methylococcaceae bacterium]|nr:GTP-binding protein [Methylococcaceae bacterium]
MLEFIHLLRQRYQALLFQQNGENPRAAYQQRIDQLILTEAFIRKGQFSDSLPEQLLQITVIGPTQAGKSSLVNVLLGSQLAGVSPLAGYTAHPQGFCQSVTAEDCSGLQRYFGRFQQLLPSQLSKNRFDCYALVANSHESDYLPRCILWDTPDFDSIDSDHYREGVLRTMALADILVLVVSKEKYADQSVWDIMSDLETLHQPTIICLNKLNEESENLVIESLKEKWQLARKDNFPEIVPLYYQKSTGQPLWPEAKKMLFHKLADRITQSAQTGKSKQARFEQELLQKHWQTWLEPVNAEHQALTDWQELVDLALKQGLDNYQRDFLHHPRHYETFQQALAELLTLLEIPGLAGILSNTRKFLTWPVKQISRLGRKNRNRNNSNELTLLNQIAEHVLIQVADKLIDKAEQSKQGHWWKECGSLLRSHRPVILQNFNLAALSYHETFQQDVATTAHRLYEKLQEQPIVLNSLRATRATTDAAAIAFALHTGGIGVQDLVLAPAMFTVTSLLTESAIGGYMHRVEAELKQHQLSTVKQALFTDSLRKYLLKLPEQLSTNTHFNISPDQLRAAESLLTEKRHGLRLL